MERSSQGNRELGKRSSAAWACRALSCPTPYGLGLEPLGIQGWSLLVIPWEAARSSTP